MTVFSVVDVHDLIRVVFPTGAVGQSWKLRKSESCPKTKPYAKLCKKIVLYMKILSFFAWHNFCFFSKWFSWENFLIALFSDKIKVILGRSLPGQILMMKLHFAVILAP